MAWLFVAAATRARAATPQAQRGSGEPSEDVEQVTREAQQTPEFSLLTIDRPIYDVLQELKRQTDEKYGFNWALENTTIYQAASGGVEPNDAMVNTLGLFATWKIIRDPNGKDYGGIGFQAETRGNPMSDHFTDMTSSLGTLWSPNDSTSDDYTKINQLWWGEKFAEGKVGVQIGKIDPGSLINRNRFAGSGNTQFFGQPYATNPARSFPDNGLGVQFRIEPADWLYFHVLMSDSDAVSTASPFTTIDGNWFYAGEVGFRPVIPNLGEGIYRIMVYQRDADAANETGWALSCDQNLSEKLGVFLRYGGNGGELNSIEHLISGGIAFLAPFDRKNDQAGVGVAWTHPSDNSLRDQYSGEVYYRLQLTEGIELSASTQLIVDPSDSNNDTEAVFGVRARILY